jgi:hypothetical protein
MKRQQSQFCVPPGLQGSGVLGREEPSGASTEPVHPAVGLLADFASMYELWLRPI